MNRAERRRQMRAGGYENSFSNGNGNGAGKVVIAYPHPHTIEAAFHTSLILLLMYDRGGPNRVSDVVQQGSGPRVAAARNELCQVFLAHPDRPDWLWFIDADMAFPPNLLEQLLEVADPVERPVIGGLCFIGGRGAKVSPTMYVLVPNDDKPYPRTESIVGYPENTVCKVDATGAACLLIHRSALEAVRRNHDTLAPWFAETSSPGGEVEFGEDITFCLRLAEASIPLYVHTGAKLGHMKPASIDEQSFFEYQAGVEEHGVDEMQRRWIVRRGLSNETALGKTEGGQLRSAADGSVVDGARL